MNQHAKPIVEMEAKIREALGSPENLEIAWNRDQHQFAISVGDRTIYFSFETLSQSEVSFARAIMTIQHVFRFNLAFTVVKQPQDEDEVFFKNLIKNQDIFEIQPNDRESVKILIEAAKVQRKKGADYNNQFSSVSQADYYPHGLNSILDIIHAKYLRIISVMEAMESDPEYKPNYESLEDSFIDMISYASFGAAWCRYKVPGQDASRGLLNKKPAK